MIDDELHKSLDGAVAEFRKLRSKLITAVNALEWYANNANLTPDIGLTARKALAEIREETQP